MLGNTHKRLLVLLINFKNIIVNMDYSEKIREQGVKIWELDDKVRKLWWEVKQEFEKKTYKQPKREFDRNKKMIKQYQNQINYLKKNK